MREIALLVWLLGSPLLDVIQDRLMYGPSPREKQKQLYTDGAIACSVLIRIVLYFATAIFIWNNF